MCTYPFSPKCPSHPGCHVTLIRIPTLNRRSLLVIHFRYSGVCTSIPISLTIPSLTLATISFQEPRWLLKRSLVFPILLFSSISLHWSLRKTLLFLLFFAILWNSAFRCFYLSFSPLLFASLLFTAMCKASPDSHFAFLHFFSMGMILIPVSCTMSRTSFHSSSGTLSELVP